MTKRSVSRLQIPSRRSNGLFDPPRLCLATQIPNRRKPHLAAASRAQVPSWGSKLQSRQKPQAAAASRAKIPSWGQSRRKPQLAAASRAQIPFWGQSRRNPQLAAASRAQIPIWGSKIQPRLAAECRVQIPSWAGKRPRVLDSRRPCSAAELQPWSANLIRIYNNLLGCSTTQKILSWGAKRARTTHSNRCVHFLTSGFISSERDWANLGDGPAGLIAELVLAKDVADYVRFRAVCRAWRRCSPDPRSQGCYCDSRYHPRQWIMLDKAAAPIRCRRFLNLTTGECIRMDLPELDEHALLALTPEGLILLLDETTRAVRLLNPLTRQLTHLPPLTALPLLPPEWLLDRRNLGKIIKVDGAGIVDASTVAVSFGCPRVLVVAKSGDEHWALVDGNRRFHSVLPFAGRFYCATRRGIEVLNASTGTGTDQQETPRLLTAVDWSRSLHVSEFLSDGIHLVDNAGDLMLVHRMLRCTHIDDYETKWAVYNVDLHGGILVPAKSLGGRAVFLGARRSVSVSVDAFVIVADTLYFGYECGGGASYNLVSAEATCYSDAIVEGDDTDEVCNHEMDCDGEEPDNIVTCLCDCIQGIGKELA